MGALVACSINALPGKGKVKLYTVHRALGKYFASVHGRGVFISGLEHLLKDSDPGGICILLQVALTAVAIVICYADRSNMSTAILPMAQHFGWDKVWFLLVPDEPPHAI
jgi:hypothetical protein